jgi:hypothetical protein
MVAVRVNGRAYRVRAAMQFIGVFAWIVLVVTVVGPDPTATLVANSEAGDQYGFRGLARRYGRDRQSC